MSGWSKGEAVSAVDGEHAQGAGDGGAFDRARIEAGRRRASEDRARLIADGLRAELDRAFVGGVLDVRAVPWGASWLVRAEVCTLDSARLAHLLALQFPGLEIPGWRFEQMELPADGGLESDPVLMAPGWFVVHPGTDYGRAYKCAMEAAAELGSVLPPVILAGPMDFDADIWEDGMGVVRISLTLEDASKLTALVGWARETATDDGYAC